MFMIAEFISYNYYAIWYHGAVITIS